MKKRTIIILATLMGMSFVCLLVLQMYYVEEVMNLRKIHFDESVQRSLSETAKQIEIAEAAKYLEQGIDAYNDISSYDSTATTVNDSASAQKIHQITTSGENIKTKDRPRDAFSEKYFTKRSSGASRQKALNGIMNKYGKSKSLQEIMKDRYDNQKDLIDEVVYNMLYTASDRPLKDRIDFRQLDQILKTELMNNGIDITYHFSVYSSNKSLVYQCPDYDAEGDDIAYTENMFKNGPIQKMATLKVHFPFMSTIRHQSVWFLMPSIVFTLILLTTFIVTLVLVFRQKKLTELKNDFINNMTHEFKTPISSISLAAQMMCDDTVPKNEKMVKRLSSTIYDETKRLRFQVEKVLQLSMYENQKARLNLQEVDANELIAGVIHTFALKVEKNGGKIITDLKADNARIYVDDMHFTNVIFNLMDNAVKYRRQDTPLELKVSTHNENGKLFVTVQDNGIGIKKDDLKKIFDKFYRVHTGNRHDVKGFGLGLAYVKKIINELKGTIVAESELGIGTKFIIRMPLV